MPSNQPGPGWLSLLRNPAVALPVAAALGGGLVFAVFEIPVLIPKAIFSFRQERAATEQAEIQAHAMGQLACPTCGVPLSQEKQRARVQSLSAIRDTGSAWHTRCDPDLTPLPFGFIPTTPLPSQNGPEPACVAPDPDMSLQIAPAQ